jgi:hypothetical protein
MDINDAFRSGGAGPTPGPASKPPSPITTAVNAALVPDALKAIDNWVNWLPQWDDGRGKWGKIPKNPHGGAASSTNRSTWSDFATCLAASGEASVHGTEGGNGLGIGFVVTPDLMITGVDLDGCRDPATGAVTNWAHQIVVDLDTYTEVSPSGTGFRLWVVGCIPPEFLAHGKQGRRKGAIEIYQGGRFLTITGKHVAGKSDRLQQRQDKLAALCQATFKEAATGAPGSNGQDHSCELVKPTTEMWAAISLSSLFEPTFKRTRTDMADMSGSSCDLALANLAVHAGWHNGEIRWMLWKARELLGDNPGKIGRDDYWQSTISKAREGKAGPQLNGSAAEPNTDTGWGEPGKITNTLTPVEPLSPVLIPEALRSWLLDVSHQMQTPPDFAAVSAITALGSIIGAGCAVKPKQNADWTVIPNLWGGCVGRPTVMLKSPSMKEIINILDKLQGEAVEAFKLEMKGHAFDLKVIEERANAQKDAVKKAKGHQSTLDRLRQDHIEADEIPAPVCKLFKTNETSIQSQTKLQAENPRGLLTFRDELMGLLTRWDRGEHEQERAYFLEGWNGDGSYTDFKIGRGLTEAPNICISLLGSIQPDKLMRYLHQSMSGGNDGLVQRFQLAVYPDELKSWELVDEPPDRAAKHRASEVFSAMANADFTLYGAEQDEHEKFPFMRFSSEGQAVFNEWLTELQHRLPDEDNPLMAEHLGKYRSLMPSLALIFHLLDIADFLFFAVGSIRIDFGFSRLRPQLETIQICKSIVVRKYFNKPQHFLSRVILG